MAARSIPSSVLIIGSGVFGLGTAYALAQREEYKNTKITVLDRLDFPAPDAGSIDTSRLVRSDYEDPVFAGLAAEALEKWRGDYGKEGRYNESGYALLLDDDGNEARNSIVANMLDNARHRLGLKIGRREDGADISLLNNRDEVKAAAPGFTGAGGDRGYINYTSGWAHAENGVRYLRKRAEELKRIEFRVAEIKGLTFDGQSDHKSVTGATLISGEKITADLTLLAAGAWSGKFIDLRGITSATGQTLAYVDLTEEEQSRLEKNPAILNPSNFMYIIPPRNKVLKVARHGYGYSNPVKIPHPERPGEMITVSLPRTKHDDPNLNIAAEGKKACRDYLTQCLPEFKDRPWSHTRICWYSDTVNGNWLIDYHPSYKGLFVATGDSGHGYKFLPVLGERIADLVMGKPRDTLGEQIRDRCRWPQTRAGLDYAWTGEERGGPKGMNLDEELAR